MYVNNITLNYIRDNNPYPFLFFLTSLLLSTDTAYDMVRID